jgi:hypothetical protein
MNGRLKFAWGKTVGADLGENGIGMECGDAQTH